MAASPYAPNKSNSVRGNEFFICSDESADKQQRDGRMNAGTTSKSIADGKFKVLFRCLRSLRPACCLCVGSYRAFRWS